MSNEFTKSEQKMHLFLCDFPCFYIRDIAGVQIIVFLIIIVFTIIRVIRKEGD